jgi:hypothetical protein
MPKTPPQSLIRTLVSEIKRAVMQHRPTNAVEDKAAANTYAAEHLAYLDDDARAAAVDAAVVLIVAPINRARRAQLRMVH